MITQINSKIKTFRIIFSLVSLYAYSSEKENKPNMQNRRVFGVFLNVFALKKTRKGEPGRVSGAKRARGEMTGERTWGEMTGESARGEGAERARGEGAEEDEVRE